MGSLWATGVFDGGCIQSTGFQRLAWQPSLSQSPSLSRCFLHLPPTPTPCSFMSLSHLGQLSTLPSQTSCRTKSSNEFGPKFPFQAWLDLSPTIYTPTYIAHVFFCSINIFSSQPYRTIRYLPFNIYFSCSFNCKENMTNLFSVISKHWIFVFVHEGIILPKEHIVHR